MVAFCGRILAPGRWNLQMSLCKCPGVLRGQYPGMGADKCINSSLFVLTCVPPNNPITAYGATSFPGYHFFPE